MSDTPPRNVADIDQIKKTAKKEKLQEELEKKDMQDLLRTGFGRRIIWRYLSFCGVFKTSFTGDSQTFFNEGQRNVGLKIIDDINEANPQAYVDMMLEAKKSS